MTEKVHPNVHREIPAEPHPDMGRRKGHIASTFPNHGARRLMAELDRTNGYIRGPKSDTLFMALKGHFDKRKAQ